MLYLILAVIYFLWGCIKWLIKTGAYFMWIMLLFCLDCFTIPLWLICVILRIGKPRLQRHLVLLYPMWDKQDYQYRNSFFEKLYVLALCLICILIAGTKGLTVCVFAFIIWAIVKMCKNVNTVTPGKNYSKEMTGLEYEHYCADRLTRTGNFIKVEVTPPTGDFGADIVAYDNSNRKWVFQCKHFKSKLGNKPIQEVVSAKAHYDAVCAAVITNSTFTESAKLLALENGVVLYENFK